MSDWGKGAQNNTIGWGQSSTNSIGYGSIYETSYAGDTALIGTSAAFLYSKSSFNQGEADPTPTITGTAGGSFNASANVVFVDTGTYNSSTGQIDLSATSIGSHIITYTVNGVQSGQTVGVTAVPYASTSSFTFDGVDSYFDAGNTINVVTANHSLSMWIKTTGNGNLVVSEKGSNDELAIQTNFSEIRWAGTNTFDTSGANINNGNWHHLAVVADGTSSFIYVDGVLNATGGNKIQASSNSSSLYIGGRANTFNFAGNLDEVSIWNTTLSQSAITEIYNSGAPNDLTSLSNASNTNLKAWYKF